MVMRQGNPEGNVNFAMEKTPVLSSVITTNHQTKQEMASKAMLHNQRVTGSTFVRY
jgi:hypothetical protein